MTYDTTANEAVATAIDLTAFDDDYAEAEVEERAESVPDGKYQVSVDKVELKTTREKGLPMLNWSLKILSGPHAGRLLWRNNVIGSPENVKWLKTDLHTCGLDLEKLSDLPGQLSSLLDVTLEVTKRTKGENENIYLNRRVNIDMSDVATDAGDDLMPF